MCEAFYNQNSSDVFNVKTCIQNNLTLFEYRDFLLWIFATEPHYQNKHIPLYKLKSATFEQPTLLFFIRGCKGRATPSGPKFLLFHTVLRKIGQIIGWFPPPRRSWHPPLWEILDPPLKTQIMVSLGEWIQKGSTPPFGLLLFCTTIQKVECILQGIQIRS